LQDSTKQPIFEINKLKATSANIPHPDKVATPRDKRVKALSWLGLTESQEAAFLSVSSELTIEREDLQPVFTAWEWAGRARKFFDNALVHARSRTGHEGMVSCLLCGWEVHLCRCRWTVGVI